MCWRYVAGCAIAGSRGSRRVIWFLLRDCQTVFHCDRTIERSRQRLMGDPVSLRPPQLNVLLLFILASLIVMQSCLIVVLICFSLMVSNIFSVCLLATCVSTSMK